MKSIAVIPARLGSTRLPRKILADIQGKPLLWHVWSRVRQATRLDGVCVATDSEQICAEVQSWGGQAYLTSPECRSGTERIASLLPQLDADFILNVQGDEPLIDPALIDALVMRWLDGCPELVTPVFPLTDPAELQNPNVVKVARTADGLALYFSRQAIPFVRDVAPEDWPASAAYWGHVGVYGYRRDMLEKYPHLPESKLEAAEKLEQLRFLEAGYRFQTVETSYRPAAVDTQADLDQVRAIFAAAQVD